MPANNTYEFTIHTARWTEDNDEKREICVGEIAIPRASISLRSVFYSYINSFF